MLMSQELMLTSYVQQDKIITMQIDNADTINDSNHTTFDKSSFHKENDSYYYLLLDTDILENIVDFTRIKEGDAI